MRFRAMGMMMALLALGGCGKETGRVPFAADGAGATTAELKAGEVQFWTDIDLEYEGDGALMYTVELAQNGAPAGSVQCNPLGSMSIKTGWVSTDIGTKHSRSGNGKMSCELSLPKGGTTAVKAKLEWAKKPAKVALKKADLVLKQ